jgi:CrcB protein
MMSRAGADAGETAVPSMVDIEAVSTSSSNEPSSLEKTRQSPHQRSREARTSSSNPRPSVDYDVPDTFRNLDEVCGEPPVQNPDEHSLRRHSTLEEDYERRRCPTHRRPGSHGASDGVEPSLSLAQSRTRRLSAASSAARESRMLRRRSTTSQMDYDTPDTFQNLNEASSVSPVQNPDEDSLYRYRGLEEARSRDQEFDRGQALRRRASQISRRRSGTNGRPPEEAVRNPRGQDRQENVGVSRFATQLYTISYLILFSMFGTLARLGLQALTVYPGSPTNFGSIWPNFAGSLVMGFLAEDRMLFRFEWGTPTYEMELRRAAQGTADEESVSSDRAGPDLAAAKKAHMATKKTIPLYIGLATGFCGSFTSFSALTRDAFLALSNDLAPSESRNGGYSFMALISVIVTSVGLSLSGLFVGAHLALALEPITPSFPYPLMRTAVDRLAVLLGWGCWVGAVVLSALPPDRDSIDGENWRGRATFALVFAPLGCLARFYASLYLNGRLASFPLGTFMVNMAGTAVFAMAWDLAHVPLGGVIGCQVLEGIEDGFCGCLTTVSTWVAEIQALRRRHAWTYGSVSVLTALALMVAIMGGLRWSQGFSGLVCTH